MQANTASNYAICMTRPHWPYHGPVKGHNPQYGHVIGSAEISLPCKFCYVRTSLSIVLNIVCWFNMQVKFRAIFRIKIVRNILAFYGKCQKDNNLKPKVQ